ncbi:MAG: hypothetical protein AMXMBFR84_03040 [Candidatus Hydrogenedentota bacterium]
MRKKKLTVTTFDLSRIGSYLERIAIDEKREKKHLAALEGELARGKVVAPEKVPSDVITMNSTVRLQDLDTGKESVYTIVFPPEADAEAGRVSVLAPIGTALLGYRSGDEIVWQAPKGARRMRVVDVLFQPEAAGQMHL